MVDKEWYHLPKGEYHSTFLKAVAMAVHRKVLDPSELQYFFDQKWSQDEIAKELYKRVKDG
jgi:hypothetical protein